MKHGPLILVGLLLAAASSWSAIVLSPAIQWSDYQPAKDDNTGTYYPGRRPGLAEQGREVYRANGCYHCHTQNVRRKGLGQDIENGAGPRRTVALDFLFDEQVMPGEFRFGPDLANFGARARKGIGADTNALVSSVLAKLYNPRSGQVGSSMPGYEFLFEVRKPTPSDAGNIVKVETTDTVPPGQAIIAKHSAVALAHYLLSLDSTVSVFESPVPQPPKKVETASAETNAPSAK